MEPKTAAPATGRMGLLQMEWDMSGRAHRECGDVCGGSAARLEITPKEGSSARANIFRNLSIHSGGTSVHLHM